MSLDKLIFLIYWRTTDAKQDIVIRETGISIVTVMDWYSLIREACIVWVEDNFEPIGGFDQIANEPRIVEIDESCFIGRKHNRGDDREHHWVSEIRLIGCNKGARLVRGWGNAAPSGHGRFLL